MNELTDAERRVLVLFKQHRLSETASDCLRSVDVIAEWPPEQWTVPNAALMTLTVRGFLVQTETGSFCLTEAGETIVETL